MIGELASLPAPRNARGAPFAVAESVPHPVERHWRLRVLVVCGVVVYVSERQDADALAREINRAVVVRIEGSRA